MAQIAWLLLQLKDLELLMKFFNVSASLHEELFYESIDVRYFLEKIAKVSADFGEEMEEW